MELVDCTETVNNMNCSPCFQVDAARIWLKYTRQTYNVPYYASLTPVAKRSPIYDFCSLTPIVYRRSSIGSRLDPREGISALQSQVSDPLMLDWWKTNL